MNEFPSLVYFETQVPNMFEGKKSCISYQISSVFSNWDVFGLTGLLFSGDLTEEEEVLQWLITQKTEDRIELITREMLEAMVEESQYLAVYFCESETRLRILELVL